MPPALSFIADVSEFQPNINPAAYVAGGFKAIIARVCYGARLDKTMPARRAQLRAAVPIIGWYLFLRASQTLASQIDAFVSVIPTLGLYEFVALDWESDVDGTTPTVAMRDQALGLLAAHYGRPPWLYGPAGLLRSHPAPAGDPEWVASYETGNPNLPGEILWQFTDGLYTSAGIPPENFPGVGKCDASVFPGTYAQLEARLGPPTPVTPPPDPPAPPAPTTEDDDMPSALNWIAHTDKSEYLVSLNAKDSMVARIGAAATGSGMTGSATASTLGLPFIAADPVLLQDIANGGCPADAIV